MKLIERAFVMRHEHLAGALVELMEIGKTSYSPDGILHPRMVKKSERPFLPAVTRPLCVTAR